MLGSEKLGKNRRPFVHSIAIVNILFIWFSSPTLSFLSRWIIYTINSEPGISFGPTLQPGTNNFSEPICKVREYSLAASSSFIKYNELGSAPRKSQVRISGGKRKCCFPLSLEVGIFWDNCCSLSLRTLARLYIQVYTY